MSHMTHFWPFVIGFIVFCVSSCFVVFVVSFSLYKAIRGINFSLYNLLLPNPTPNRKNVISALISKIRILQRKFTSVYFTQHQYAYMIIRRLRKAWESFDLTVKDGLGQLATVCSMEVKIEGQDVCCVKIPQPREQSRQLLEALKIKLPEALPKRDIGVVTRKKTTKTKKIPIISRHPG